ncbi:MAG: aspartate/tyrosine/aromatic aminotransferase [Sphingopyxis sp.]|nr:aspartate/tyrosine/aromatic aminotransferase [Sphingopyxis sp.]
MSVSHVLAPHAPLFAGIESAAPDALLALIGLHAADPRSGKIDVGVGVYRDEAGATPVLAAVKAAEHQLLEQQTSKSYLGPEGDVQFTRLLADILFGTEFARAPGLVGLQTPGGTGALRVAAELLAQAGAGRQVWVGLPTWANHIPLLAAAGLRVREHRFFDGIRSDLDFDGMIAALSEAQAGDILLLHGCCHNPTGISFSHDQWKQLAGLCVSRSLFPLIDIAYQGLGDGLREDAVGMRLFLEHVPEALIAYSCDKNFGLYRERVGALWAWTRSREVGGRVMSQLCALARVNWSMPPDHGAALVRLILSDDALRASWMSELEAMRQRIAALRVHLGSSHPKLAPIARQKGMFAMLPILPDAVAALRQEHAIYMASNGRINVAGLSESSIDRFCDAIRSYLSDGQSA